MLLINYPRILYIILMRSINIFYFDKLNERIQSYSYYTPEAKNKPSYIGLFRRYFIGPVVLHELMIIDISASQMWNLAVSADRIPRDNECWECFLLLLELCTTRVASSAHASILEALTHDHRQVFVRCYPTATVTPKMHYMIHFPCQIMWLFLVYIFHCLKSSTGPLISTWCMRMEGNNSYFKLIAPTSILMQTHTQTKVDCVPGVLSTCTQITFFAAKKTIYQSLDALWMLISGSALLEVTSYLACGIDGHYHSYVIQISGETEYYWLFSF